MIEKDKLALRR